MAHPYYGNVQGLEISGRYRAGYMLQDAMTNEMNFGVGVKNDVGGDGK